MSGYKIDDQFAPHFITMTIVGWIDVFTRLECKEIMIEAFIHCIKEKGMMLHAYVIMESHVHIVASTQEGSIGLSSILRDLKKHTSKAILKWVKNGKESRKEWMMFVFKTYAKKLKKVKKYQVWQHKNHAKECKHPKFTIQKINYIHNNPVSAGIVSKPEDYVFSSARNYFGEGELVIEVEKMEYGSLEGYVYM